MENRRLLELQLIYLFVDTCLVLTRILNHFECTPMNESTAAALNLGTLNFDDS